MAVGRLVVQLHGSVDLLFLFLHFGHLLVDLARHGELVVGHVLQKNHGLKRLQSVCTTTTSQPAVDSTQQQLHAFLETSILEAFPSGKIRSISLFWNVCL
jgi:hypothetical protein